MSITEKALTNLESLKDKIPIWAKDAIIENKELILDILKDRQLSQGLAYSGDITLGNSTTYAKSTQDYYAIKFGAKTTKIAGAKYNMQWSKELFNTLDLKVSEAEYDIFSTTGKDTFLESIFGGGSFTKFREENNDFVNRNIIEPYLADKIQENLFDF